MKRSERPSRISRKQDRRPRWLAVKSEPQTARVNRENRAEVHGKRMMDQAHDAGIRIEATAHAAEQELRAAISKAEAP